MLVNGVSIDLELDSGSPVSIMPKWQYEKYFQSNKLEVSDVRLSTYTGEVLKIGGFMPVTVEYNKRFSSN